MPLPFATQWFIVETVDQAQPGWPGSVHNVLSDFAALQYLIRQLSNTA
jgi:hypothetical protein